MLAYILPLEGGLPNNDLPGGGGGGSIDNTLPGGGQLPGLPPGWWTKPPRPEPWPPIALPPLPGIWPPPGQIQLPIVLPPTVWPPRPPHEGGGGGVVAPPIYIDGSPTLPIALPPGIYPPLPPRPGIKDKYAVLIWVLGVGWRWAVIDPSLDAGMPLPPTPEPK